MVACLGRMPCLDRRDRGDPEAVGRRLEPALRIGSSGCGSYSSGSAGRLWCTVVVPVAADQEIEVVERCS